MVFLMPGEKAAEEARKAPASSTPREIVAELDKFIVGQKKAKKAVAVALRNRWRRQQLEPEMAREILPKNILMIGPTGVGKTEIARRLARLAGAPFIKVEASKFTEVGYVGRDVESIVRDLTEVAVQMVRDEKTFEIRDRARARTEQRLLDLLLPAMPEREGEETRVKLRTMLRDGQLEDRMVEVEVADKTFPSFEIVTNQGVEEMDINVKEMLPGLFGGKKKRRKTTVAEAREILQAEEEGRLVDPGQVAREAVERAQSSGIVFLDEIDKVAGRESGRGPDVSREGVQRDLLPIVEGTSVNTKYGFVKTDHVLFIAAGAFHVSKPSDLIPELQGRFPIRVELESLTEEDFVRILTEPENALLEAVPRPARGRGRRAVVLRGGDPRDRPRRGARQPRAREHRRATAPHDPRAAAGGDLVRGPRERRPEDLDRGRRRALGAVGSREERGSVALRSVRRALLAALTPFLAFALACGKKGDPTPPLPRGPRAVSDLAVEQEGAEAVLTFSYPDRLLTGAPLTDLAAIEVYRVVGATSALTAPRGGGSAGAATDEAPAAGARRAAIAARQAEEAFYREAKPAASLAASSLGQYSRGASVVYRDPLMPLLEKGTVPTLAYAVVSVRRNGERSPLSNIVTLSPEAPPDAPVIGDVSPRGREDLPRMDGAGEGPARPARRRRRVLRLPAVPAAGRVRPAAQPERDAADVVRRHGRRLRRRVLLHGARDPARKAPHRGASRR